MTLDPLEIRDPAAREAAQFAALAGQLAATRDAAPALAEQLGDTDPASVTDRAALARLPVMRKATLVERQRAAPPFGGLAARPLAGFTHVFQSPGPLYEPGRVDRPDWWRFARALRAAGIGAGDVVLNA
ncbi:MAG: phenylacetate--CoA ligase family protein, partial [Pseudomonadota bacterium]